MAPRPANPELVVRSLSGGITTFSAPFTRIVVPFGGRSTAVKLNDGSVWLLASTPLDTTTAEKLKELGPVSWIVSPDREHHMFLQEYKEAYPEAKTVGCEGLLPMESQKGFKFDYIYGRDECPFAKLLSDQIKAEPFGKSHVNEDIAFLHIPSQTLIEADLLLNLPAKEQYSKSKASGSSFMANHLSPGSWLHKKLVGGMMTKDKAAMTQHAKTVASWEFSRIIPCHGDIIETGGKKAWTSTYASLLQG